MEPMSSAKRYNAAIDSLIATTPKLGEDEMCVLAVLAERLLKGQTVYGKLNIDEDKRDWDREAYEEDLDSAVYRAIGHVKRTRGKTGQKKRPNNGGRSGV